MEVQNRSARTARCISSRRSAGDRERHCSERARPLFCPTHLLQWKCAAGWQCLNNLHLPRMSFPSPRSGLPAPLGGGCLSQQELSSADIPRNAAQPQREVCRSERVEAVHGHARARALASCARDDGVYCELSENFTLGDTTHKVFIFQNVVCQNTPVCQQTVRKFYIPLLCP